MSVTSGGSTKVDMWEIKKRLQEDGLDPACEEDEKLRHVWRLYLKAESDLKTSLMSIEQLRLQQSEEMKEVENYVEHIRSLSDEREALTMEFEQENEQLKGEVDKLTEELEGYKNDETREMLIQQGLDDIANGSTSEQIAYLLVERARLMDELEAEQTQATVQTPEGAMTATQIWQVLEQERADFEDELQQQRDSTRAVKEQLRKNHEEEINSVMSENEKLQDIVDEAKNKTAILQKEVNNLREELERKTEENSQLQQQVRDAALSVRPDSRQGIDSDTIRLTGQLRELEADNSTLAENVESLTLQLQEQQSQTSDHQRTARRLQADSDTKQIQINQLETALERLRGEKQQINERLEHSERLIDDMKRGHHSNTQNSHTTGDSESNERLEAEVQGLQETNQTLRYELTTAHEDVSRYRSRVEELENRLDAKKKKVPTATLR